MSGSCPSTSTHTFPILDTFSVTVEATHNPLQIPLECLFSMAARINKKRSFLFVSKVLGKHIPVHPYSSLLSGAALAVLLYEDCVQGADERISEWKRQIFRGITDADHAQQAYQVLLDAGMILPEKVRFVGFAETATALGHSMYEMFKEQATYIHSTREYFPDVKPNIRFEEEHSHATAHRCYALETEALEGSGPLVLVDDEMTTGNTTLNIIRDIQRQYPRSRYYIASLLDWRTEADERRFAELEAELGIEIIPLSLLKGKFWLQGEPRLEQMKPIRHDAEHTNINHISVADKLDSVIMESADSEGRRCSGPYVRMTGRFGIQSADNAKLRSDLSDIAQVLRQRRRGQRTLVMGTGEFMYIPMRVAAEMGEGIYYQSTTRSPIQTIDRPDYAVVAGKSYASPEDPTVMNYIYNVVPGQYDEIFVLVERQMPKERMQPMIDALSGLGCEHIHMVYCGISEEG